MPSDKRSGGDGRKPPRGPRPPADAERPSGSFRRPRADGDAPPRRSYRDRGPAADERPSHRDRDAAGEGRPVRRGTVRAADDARPQRPVRQRDEAGEERRSGPRASFRDRREEERPGKPRPPYRSREDGEPPRRAFRDRAPARPSDDDRRPRMERIERGGEGPHRPFRSFQREDRSGERPVDEHRRGGGHSRDEDAGRDHERGRPFRSRFEVAEDERGPRRAFEPRFEDRRERRPPGRSERPPRPGKRPVVAEAADAPAPVPAESGYEGDRVAKVVARAGLGSRRDVETWIEEGRVAVNGEVLTSAARNVTAQDRITIDGKPLPQRERTRLWLYHKPRGLMTTEKDPEGRPTVFESLPAGLPRVMSVGRLDINTEGLLLLTNDGGLARLLELPKTGWMRRYRVRAHGETDQSVLDELFKGVTVDGVEYGPVEARLDKEQGSNSWLTLGVREGKNREVRNVLASIGLEVNRLIRVSYGPFQLGELAEGAVEEIKTRVLQDQLGADLVAEAECVFDAPVFERPAEAPVAAATTRKERRRGLRIEAGEGETERVMRGSLIEDRRGRRVLVQRLADVEEEKPARRPRPSARDQGEGGERPFKPRASFRDRDEGGARPFKPRTSFRDRDEGGERPFKPRASFRDRDEGGERPFKPRASFRDRDEGSARPFKPRAPARDRDEGGERPFKPRASFRDRDEGSARPFKPRASFRDRDEGGERPSKPRASFRDRDEGGARPFKPRAPARDRDESGERPFKPRTSFRDRDEGSARPFKPRASFRDRDGGSERPFKPRAPFRDRDEGGVHGKPGGGKGPRPGKPRRPRDA